MGTHTKLSIVTNLKAGDRVMADREQVFVAYSSRDPAVATIVLDAARLANALPLPVIYQPWQFNDVAGNPLVSPILEKIDDSLFVVADITYLNLNVVYEIGFAIGHRKRAFLIRHKSTDGDKHAAKSVGIFDTLGYHEYNSAEDLKDRLAAHIYNAPPVFNCPRSKFAALPYRATRQRR
jgi:hypothetical protein